MSLCMHGFPFDSACIACGRLASAQEHTWSGSQIVVIHCKHGLDLRIFPVCYLCNPRQERGEQDKARQRKAGKRIERARIRAAVEGLNVEHNHTAPELCLMSTCPGAVALAVLDIVGGER